MALLFSLARLNVQLHPLTVDVADPEMACFGQTQTRCIKCGEERAVFEVRGASEEFTYFLTAQDDRQFFGTFAKGNHGHLPRAGDRDRKKQT